MKAHSGFRKGERASEGRGCPERGTLNADRKAHRKGAALFKALLLMTRAAKSQLKKRIVVTRNSQKKNVIAISISRCYRSAHLLAFSMVLRM